MHTLLPTLWGDVDCFVRRKNAVLAMTARREKMQAIMPHTLWDVITNEVKQSTLMS
ncbi:MAG: hypothetical protein HY939_07820 [Gammaproteobacteria bacterium]|nr:hypothetical protein [Gammaproteobacteria bacterium]